MNLNEVANNMSSNRDDEDAVLMVSEDWDGHATNDFEEVGHQFYVADKDGLGPVNGDIFTNGPGLFQYKFIHSKLEDFATTNQDVVVDTLSEMDKWCDSKAYEERRRAYEKRRSDRLYPSEKELAQLRSEREQNQSSESVPRLWK